VSSFSPWGGLGKPGEACVKCGWKESMLGAHAPTRGASQKISPHIKVRFCQFSSQHISCHVKHITQAWPFPHVSILSASFV